MALAGAATLWIGSLPVLAADASAWDEDARAGTRLIAGDGTKTSVDGALRAGIDIKLARGWKTYWRYPGDSGVPPHFDFAGSSNLKSVSVLWPAPHRFTDGGGQSIGYKDRVIFPLRIVPQDASKPVTLRARLEFGICEKLCVPVQSKAELTLARVASAHDSDLAAAEAQVPAAATLGESKDLTIVAVRRATGAKPQVTVDVKGPDTLDLFVEGPTPDWALPLPMPTTGAPAGTRRFTFELDGLPPGAKADGATLTLTAVAGARAIEVKTRLD
jgi:DsbC/DsbD-like thiol-disulfide interchange protein